MYHKLYNWTTCEKNAVKLFATVKLQFNGHSFERPSLTGSDVDGHSPLRVRFGAPYWQCDNFVMKNLIALKERLDLDGDLFTDNLHWRIQGALGDAPPLGPFFSQFYAVFGK